MDRRPPLPPSAAVSVAVADVLHPNPNPFYPPQPPPAFRRLSIHHPSLRPLPSLRSLPTLLQAHAHLLVSGLLRHPLAAGLLLRASAAATPLPHTLLLFRHLPTPTPSAPTPSSEPSPSPPTPSSRFHSSSPTSAPASPPTPSPSLLSSPPAPAPPPSTLGRSATPRPSSVASTRSFTSAIPSSTCTAAAVFWNAPASCSTRCPTEM
uniref:Proline-rich receptor-like protein kinase PERK2 n=1 Tax=Elaeis guineensis var. tenera TaxID=51953 RepID=A0A8N4ESV7_ELAGV|nr:proline-rich receptor-like protein kinase PERK2 [Elaeis guineensis]